MKGGLCANSISVVTLINNAATPPKSLLQIYVIIPYKYFPQKLPPRENLWTGTNFVLLTLQLTHETGSRP